MDREIPSTGHPGPKPGQRAERQGRLSGSTQTLSPVRLSDIHAIFNIDPTMTDLNAKHSSLNYRLANEAIWVIQHDVQDMGYAVIGLDTVL